jgi:hypothetical protein
MNIIKELGQVPEQSFINGLHAWVFSVKQGK